ncbi:hypothetical protein CSC70_08345 [Pseudoxanthomonas kalamensis DSM 18571]|nr:hypothetical protein CSC70_08345 [Pseudoxanthomonas kalamensis DSM 18571]
MEWRPSRWLAAFLLLIGVLAALAVLVSGLSPWCRWPLALLAPVCGAWQAWRWLRRPYCTLVIPGNDAPVRLDGAPLESFRLQWRGPLAFVCWRGRDGRSGRLSWWPDTLPAARRRELRLAGNGPRLSPDRRAMAP